MKKIISLITILAVIFCFTACSNSSTESETQSASQEVQTSENNTENQTNSAEELTEKVGKSLVVYFSHSGNTEKVAKEIQLQTGADIFEIEPSTPYTTDYNTLLDVAQQEQRDNARPEISGSIENLEQYDTVYVGYPNWWGDMPMILYTFFDTYDLSGKTVSPFCTSGGSGLSDTVNAIKSLEPNATVTEGLAIRDSSANSSANSVTDWLNDIGAEK